jgi:hypothetical protein
MKVIPMIITSDPNDYVQYRYNFKYTVTTV